MAMAAATKQWTLDELHSLPDDGNKYELIHGELYVTPAPSPGHETVAARLNTLLVPYVVRHNLGFVYHPRSVIRWRGSEVEPDLMVRQLPTNDLKDDGWERMPTPRLVVEVSSRSTRRRDTGVKREFYMEVGVSEYWYVDRASRTLRVFPLGLEEVFANDSYRWQPSSASEPFIVEVGPLFG